MGNVFVDNCEIDCTDIAEGWKISFRVSKLSWFQTIKQMGRWNRDSTTKKARPN